MANPEIVKNLLAALEHDNPSEWVAYFEQLRKETGKWERIAYDFPEHIHEIRAEEVRKKNADLTNADFSGKIFNSRLYDIESHNRIMIPEEFQGKNMYYKQEASDDYYFTGLNFGGSSFERTIFRGCSFSNNNLSNIKAKNAVFAGCPFRMTDEGSGSTFEKAELQDAIFHYCGFGNTLFPGADLSRATFNHCNFFGHYLENGPRWYAFRDTKLTDTKFLHCDLSKTGITQAQLEQCASIESSTLPPECEKVRDKIQTVIDERNEQRRLDEEDAARRAEEAKIRAAEEARRNHPTPGNPEQWAKDYGSHYSLKIIDWSESGNEKRWPLRMRSGMFSKPYFTYSQLLEQALTAAADDDRLKSYSDYKADVHHRFAELVVDALHKVGRIEKTDFTDRREDLITNVIAALDSNGKLPERDPSNAERLEAEADNAKKTITIPYSPRKTR